VELFVDDVRARFASEKLAQLEERTHGEVDWDPEDLQAGFVLTVCPHKGWFSAKTGLH
jgi:hypothetical protein